MPAMAIKAGMANIVALVYGNDQRSARRAICGGPAAMGGNMFLSYVYHAPWGLTSQGALYAMMQRRYMALTGASERDLRSGRGRRAPMGRRPIRTR